MFTRKHIANPEEIIERYESGISLLALSKESGIGRKALENFLRQSGVTIRGLNESQSLRFSKMTSQERRDLNAPGRAAWLGSKHSVKAKEKAAATRQEHRTTVSPAELELTSMLRLLGYQPSHQTAVGIYNIDITIDSLGIEILGGSWHNTRNHNERTRFLLNEGWNLLFIWVIPDRFPITQSAAYYAHGFATEMRLLIPSSVRNYRVIKGTGQEVVRGDSLMSNFPLAVSKSQR
jgi:very-short-patch-repair endonuclease